LYRAVSINLAFSSCALNDGYADVSNARAPLTCGVAMEVPERNAYPPG
jgi:hypothetical protein